MPTIIEILHEALRLVTFQRTRKASCPHARIAADDGCRERRCPSPQV